MNKFLLIFITITSIFGKNHYISNHIKEKTYIQNITEQKKDSSNKNLILKNSLTNNFKFSSISKNELNFSDYRYSGNFFSLIPFGFLRDLGSTGQPSEVLLYGQGYNNLSFLKNGILQNNRLFNSFDLYLLQTESIDTIEIIPLSRGFLYGINNSASINFISDNFPQSKSYSRIRFYQAPNEEGLIDGIFKIKLNEKINLSTEITNQSIDPYYRNSDYSLWQGSIKADYILKNNFILSSSFYHIKSNVQLNGGVNADSIRNVYPETEFNDVFYNNILAPVKYYNRYQKVTSNNFDIRLIGKLTENSYSDFSFYYKNNLIEFRQNDTTNTNYQTNAEKIFHNNKYKTFGLRFRQDVNFSFINLSLINEFENNKFFTNLLYETNSINTYSSSLVLSSMLPGNIGTLSIFGKYLNYDRNDFYGMGSDIILNPGEKFQIYFGASTFQKPYNLFEQKNLSNNLLANKQSSNTIEFKTSYNSDIIKISLGYFYTSTSNKPISAIMQKEPLINDEGYYFNTSNVQLKGINLLLSTKLWKILLHANTSYYFSEEDRKIFSIPEFTFTGGFYFVDLLFNSNLYIKTGINFYAFGKRNSNFIDFEKNISSAYRWLLAPNIWSIPSMPDEIYKSEFQIDFFTAGRIKERAIIYFVFENILNRKYFIVPYYPKQPQGLRIGIAWEFLD